MFRSRRNLVVALAAFLLALLPATTSARAQLNRWLELDGDLLKDPHVGVRVNLSTTGGKFVKVNLVKRSEVARARFVGTRGEVSLTDRLREWDLRLLELPIELLNDTPGWVAVDWMPSDWEWSADRWREYLASLAMLDQIRPDEKPVKVHISTFYKLLVHRHRGSPQALTRPVGQPLEIVPLADPLSAGNMMTVRVFMKGAPSRGIRVAAQLMEGFGSSSGTTDSEGKVSLTLEGRGAWVLRAAVVSEGQGGQHEVVRSIVTLQRP